MKTGTLNDQEHSRITAAIRAAENRTAGEIYCVVARSSDEYFFSAAFLVTVGIIPASLAVAFGLEYFWITVRLPIFVAAQILALCSAFLLLWAAPSLRMALVPRGLQYRAAHYNALRQFLARNVHITAQRTGVLIFVSLAERYAEVVADSGINAKVPQETWDDVIARLTDHARQGQLADGFVGAIGTVGDLLATHFPISDGDSNELDDHLVEL